MYYGIAADNGFGVYDNYSQASRNGQYLKKGKQMKGFETFYQAFEWASGIYNEGQEDFDAAFYGCCSDIKPNWVLYRNEIIKMNKKN